MSSVTRRISRGAPTEGMDTLAHRHPAQGADPAERHEPEAAQEVRRQEVGQEGAVEAVDGRGPEAHVEVAAALIAPERRRASYVLAGSVGVHDGVAERRGVAKAEVQALRPDRREDMRGFADEREAIGKVALDRKAAHRHETARAVDAHLAEDRLRLALDRRRELLVVELHQALGMVAVGHPDEARAPARHRHERERPGAGVELGRGVAVVALVREMGRERRLRVAPGAGRDAGGLAQARVAPVRRDDEARRDG